MKKITPLTLLFIVVTCISCSRTSDRIAALEKPTETSKTETDTTTTSNVTATTPNVTATTPEVKTTTPDVTQNTKLPKLNLTNLDGTVNDMSAMKGKRLVFMLFQPDCEHCQNEAKQIGNRITSFNKYDVYFISSAPAEEIGKFAKTYKFDKLSNFHFVKTDVSSVIDNYGPIPAPSIFVYNAEGNLENKFEGEMELDVVLKYL